MHISHRDRSRSTSSPVRMKRRLSWFYFVQSHCQSSIVVESNERPCIPSKNSERQFSVRQLRALHAISSLTTFQFVYILDAQSCDQIRQINFFTTRRWSCIGCQRTGRGVSQTRWSRFSSHVDGERKRALRACSDQKRVIYHCGRPISAVLLSRYRTLWG